jgi:hypothetical protein
MIKAIEVLELEEQEQIYANKEGGKSARFLAHGKRKQRKNNN